MTKANKKTNNKKSTVVEDIISTDKQNDILNEFVYNPLIEASREEKEKKKHINKLTMTATVNGLMFASLHADNNGKVPYAIRTKFTEDGMKQGVHKDQLKVTRQAIFGPANGNKTIKLIRECKTTNSISKVLKENKLNSRSAVIKFNRVEQQIDQHALDYVKTIKPMQFIGIDNESKIDIFGSATDEQIDSFYKMVALAAEKLINASEEIDPKDQDTVYNKTI